MTLDDRIQRYIEVADIAVSGSNGHSTFIRVAINVVQGFDLSDGEAERWLTVYSDRCSPPWSTREIQHKVSQAQKATAKLPRGWLLGQGDKSGAHGSSAPPAPAPQTGRRVEVPPKFDQVLLKRLAEKCPVSADMANVYELGLRSSVEPSSVSSAQFLAALYGADERVLVFTSMMSQGDFVYGPNGYVVRSERDGADRECVLPFGGPDGVWFLANPVDGKWYPTGVGRNKARKNSRRSGASITAWRYLVLESDEAGTREWLQLLMWMPLEIVAIYTSGSRSIHALVRVNAADKAEFDAHRAKAIKYLVRFGADEKAISGVRLTRLPGCYRGNPPGTEQKLLFLDPDSTGVPIIERGRRQVNEFTRFERMADLVRRQFSTWTAEAVKNERLELLSLRRWLWHYRRVPRYREFWDDVWGLLQGVK